MFWFGHTYKHIAYCTVVYVELKLINNMMQWNNLQHFYWFVIPSYEELISSFSTHSPGFKQTLFYMLFFKYSYAIMFMCF